MADIDRMGELSSALHCFRPTETVAVSFSSAILIMIKALLVFKLFVRFDDVLCPDIEHAPEVFGLHHF